MRVHSSTPDLSYEIGWCLEHRDLAKRFDDGSWSCWWEDIVEKSGHHDNGDFVGIIEANTRRELRD